MNNLDTKLEELRASVSRTENIKGEVDQLVSRSKVQVSFNAEEFLDFAQRAVSSITEKIVGLLVKDVASKQDAVMAKIDKMVDQAIEASDATVEATDHLKKLSVPQTMSVKNVHEIARAVSMLKSPVITFPDSIGEKIVSAVKAAELPAVSTRFRRDETRQIVQIVEQYQRFVITTNFERDGSGYIKEITTAVSRL